jgi:hypothetical protein
LDGLNSCFALSSIAFDPSRRRPAPLLPHSADCLRLLDPVVIAGRVDRPKARH